MMGPGAVAAMTQLEEHFERCYPTQATESVGWVEGIAAYTRLENRAAAAVLVRVGELFAYRISRCSDREDLWAADTETAVAGEVAAALRISQSTDDAGDATRRYRSHVRTSRVPSRHKRSVGGRRGRW